MRPSNPAHGRYASVNLTRPGCRYKKFYIHRLVAQAFLGTIRHGLTVNHKNGDRYDNRSENLEIVSMRENVTHSIRVLGNWHGRRGEQNARARLTANDVLAMRQLAKIGRTTDIAKLWGLKDYLAYQVITGRTWRHLLPSQT